MITLQLIFWICLFLVAYTYILFPLVLKLLAGNRSLKARSYAEEELPVISVLIAAHNEEKMIGVKIDSVISGDYPSEKLEILVGSDASTDRTNDLLKQKKKTRIGSKHGLKKIKSSLKKQE